MNWFICLHHLHFLILLVWIEKHICTTLQVTSTDYEDLQSVLQINIIEGGKTPILSPVELGKIGYSLIVYSVSLLGVSMRAMKVCILTHMKHVTSFFLFISIIKGESCANLICLNTT
jgi:2-methylisocitrate lyase-like PEP mutase family enzyme